MPIDAVIRGVQLSADEPLREREIPLQDLAEGLEPRELLRALAPESLGVVGGALIQCFVLGDTLDRRRRG